MNRKEKRRAYRLGLAVRRGEVRLLGQSGRAELLRRHGFDPGVDDSVPAFERGYLGNSRKATPTCLTHFRKLGRKRLGKLSPELALSLHLERQRRHEADRAEAKRPRLCCWPKHLIPLGGHDMGVRVHLRARNWTASEASYGRSHESQDGQGSYSSRCQWERYTYTRHVESWGIVAAGHLRFVIDTDDGVQTRILHPWRGWHWTVDANGICLVDSRGQRDYHPTAGVLLDNPSTRAIAVIARERAARRRAVAAEMRAMLADVRRAEREGAMVCLADSVRAGNCRAGSTQWARLHDLDPTKHYRPSEVMDLASNGDASRVRLVVVVALKRHKEELRRGYCVLADHTA